MAEENEYERQRRENIKQNAALLKQLDLHTASTAIRPAKARASPAAKRAKPKPRAPREPAVATRASSRIAGIELAKEDPEEAAKRQREEEEAWEAERQRLKRAKHENRYLNALSRTGLELPEEHSDSLKAALKGLTDRERPKPAVAELIETELRAAKGAALNDKSATPSKRGKGKGKASSRSAKSTGGGGDDDHAALREAFDGLELRRLERIVPERIYSMAVHRTPHKDLVFVGDKVGHLGIWDALEPLPEADDDDADDAGDGKAKTDWSVRARNTPARRSRPAHGLVGRPAAIATRRDAAERAWRAADIYGRVMSESARPARGAAGSGSSHKHLRCAAPKLGVATIRCTGLVSCKIQLRTCAVSRT